MYLKHTWYTWSWEDAESIILSSTLNNSIPFWIKALSWGVWKCPKSCWWRSESSCYQRYSSSGGPPQQKEKRYSVSVSMSFSSKCKDVIHVLWFQGHICCPLVERNNQNNCRGMSNPCQIVPWIGHDSIYKFCIAAILLKDGASCRGSAAHRSWVWHRGCLVPVLC